MIALPALRQVVLLSADLTPALAAARDFLGLNEGVREEQGMAALGFEHEVLAIDHTFVEIVAPLTPDSSPGRLLARQGESGYMVVVQVGDLDGVLDRAGRLGIAPIMRELLEGNPISQWHPRDLGTLAEFDQIDDGREWHFCPELTATGSTAVVSDIVAVEVGVGNPAAIASRWAELLGIEIPDGATSVALGLGEIRFIDIAVAGRGLVSAQFRGRSERSTTICGVRLSITDRE